MQLEEALAAKQEATTLAVMSAAERDEALGKVEQTKADTDFVIRGLEDKCRQVRAGVRFETARACTHISWAWVNLSLLAFGVVLRVLPLPPKGQILSKAL